MYFHSGLAAQAKKLVSLMKADKVSLGASRWDPLDQKDKPIDREVHSGVSASKDSGEVSNRI